MAIAKLFNVTTDFLLDESIDSCSSPNVSVAENFTDRLLVKLEEIFHKYGWLLGVLLCFVGVSSVVSSLVGIAEFGKAASVTGNIGFIVSPVIGSIWGILIFALGVFLAKKLKK